MANLKDIGYGIGKYLTVSDASDIPDIGTNRKNLDLLNFKVAVNNAYALYNFKDGMIDAYQTEGGVDASGSTDILYDSTLKYYYGGVSPTATGGTVTTVGAYTIHSFLNVGNTTFTTDTAQNMSILVVGGGGGGGGASATAYRTGGGGAGGVRVVAASAFTAASHTVTVGPGGGGGATTVNGTNGSSSTVNSITASGGGGGGGTNLDGSAGASGGGGSANSKSGGSGNSGGYSPVEGYAGGGGDTGISGATGGGGGGGAGQAGENRAGGGNAGGGYGGDGIQNDYRTGSNVYYGGGGGGGSSGAGGDGGGGGNANWPTGLDGTANSGGGGAAGTHAGSSPYWPGGDGGSGIVVIKRETIVKGNMTLLSAAQTAQAAPDEGRLMLYEEDVDSITLDTDLKGYVSRDGGTTYTQTPLVEDTTYEAGKRLLSGSVDISGQPAGTDMKYKVETLNDKKLNLHGASLLWA